MKNKKILSNIIRIGNSTYASIPKRYADHYSVKEGDVYEIQLQKVDVKAEILPNADE